MSTTASGESRINAEMVDFTSDAATQRRDDGRNETSPRNMLSELDNRAWMTSAILGSDPRL